MDQTNRALMHRVFSSLNWAPLRYEKLEKKNKVTIGYGKLKKKNMYKLETTMYDRMYQLGMKNFRKKNKVNSLIQS